MDLGNLFGFVINQSHVKYIVLVSLLIGIVYFYFLKQRNECLPPLRILVSFTNFLVLLICLFFAYIGILITFFVIVEQQYIALIIPLGWFYICYNNIYNIISTDFGIKRKRLFKFKFASTFNSLPFIMLVLAIGFLLTSILIFSILGDTANQPYGPFPLFISGIIFLFSSLLLFATLFSLFKNKIKFQKTGSNSYRLVSNIKKVDDFSKEGYNSAIANDKKVNRRFITIFIIYFVLFAILFIYVIVKDAQINKKTKIDILSINNNIQ